MDVVHTAAAGLGVLTRLEASQAAHGQLLSPSELRLDVVAHAACELSRTRVSAVGPAAILLREIHGAPLPVEAERGELLSAVLNLIAHAVDAMPRGGTIDVTTGTGHGGAWVKVCDEGPATPAALHEIFAHLVTPEGAIGGDRGLAQVLECAQRHGGSVSMQRRVVRGSSLTLWLPAKAHAGEPSTS